MSEAEPAEKPADSNCRVTWFTSYDRKKRNRSTRGDGAVNQLNPLKQNFGGSDVMPLEKARIV